MDSPFGPKILLFALVLNPYSLEILIPGTTKALIELDKISTHRGLELEQLDQIDRALQQLRETQLSMPPLLPEQNDPVAPARNTIALR